MSTLAALRQSLSLQPRPLAELGRYLQPANIPLHPVLHPLRPQIARPLHIAPHSHERPSPLRKPHTERLPQRFNGNAASVPHSRVRVDGPRHPGVLFDRPVLPEFAKIKDADSGVCPGDVQWVLAEVGLGSVSLGILCFTVLMGY